MRAAIYARKSKYTDKGESIKNQIDICSKYAVNNFQITTNDIDIYEDEGFSGKNISRPQLQRLLSDIKENKFKILICYKLDRISRSISDFSILINYLEKYKVSFVSVKEQFDTSTPIGRAMMYITSVFAQLERETTAERITDNFTGLAATGRYLGWKAPDGFKKEQIKYTDKNGAVKKYNILETDKESTEKIRLIYNKFNEWKNIKRLESYLKNNGVKNSNGNNYSTIALRRILTHPDYMTADEEAYNYFNEIGAKIVSEKNKFDGKHGISVLRRTGKKSEGNCTYSRDCTEWLVSVGYHKGIIKSNEWIDIQKILTSRKSEYKYNIKNKRSCLSGILYCSCGSHMRPSGYKDKRFYYSCENKNKSKGSICNTKNIRGDVLDKEVNKIINQIFEVEKKTTHEIKPSINFEKQIKEKKEKINLLIENLTKISSYSVQRHIENSIIKIDNEIIELKNKMTSEIKTENIYLNRDLIRKAIKKITWDGDKILIELSAYKNKI